MSAKTTPLLIAPILFLCFTAINSHAQNTTASRDDVATVMLPAEEDPADETPETSLADNISPADSAPPSLSDSILDPDNISTDYTDAVPQAYDEDRYIAAWDKNPFALKTKVIEQTRESFAKDYSLQYVINTSGKYYIGIVNKQTQKRLRLMEGDTSQDFRIVEVNFDRDRNKTNVKVARGSETAELTYDETVLSTPVTVQNTQALMAGQDVGGAEQEPGQPSPQNMRPPDGMPQVRPGMPGYNPGRAGAMPPGMTPQVPTPGNMRPAGSPPPPSATPSSINNRRRQLIPSPITRPENGKPPVQ